MKLNSGKIKLIAGLFALVVASIGNTASADISQGPNQANGFFSDVTFPQSIADNFVVTAGGPLNYSLSWWGGYFPSNTAVSDSFAIRIHGDLAGLPDSSAAFLNLSGVTADLRVDTGVNLFGVDEYMYTLNLGALNLAPGTYWLEIFNDTSQNGDNWFWETGNLDNVNGIANDAFSQTTPGVVWFANGAEQAFTLTTSPIPEPSLAGTILLLGLGFIANRRRK